MKEMKIPAGRSTDLHGSGHAPGIASSLQHRWKGLRMLMFVLAVFAAGGARATITDDLTISAAPYVNTDFSINGLYWGTVFGSQCTSNAKAPDTYKSIGVIADADHYISNVDNAYKFECTETGKTDMQSAHLVIYNTVPGTLKITFKGSSPSNFNLINVSRNPEWKVSGDNATTLSSTDYDASTGATLTKSFWSTGKIYIAANYGMSITGLEWIPFNVG